ncbi:ExeM/NucH family extracellular endonuclease [Pseudomarimonas arenosa]|uniref:ExeM/NucH family extracellular endonuclease n=1 Tax=Pseudomarimonas arenosa TaxID=2774145 RepID=A0AAW3ZPJ3_9GAMM|nr:ExeM/NucH family extracellular endonuclease [Pseudomarimonas arenosa]MBD8526840.1 ExeM/NucH family extracellular endonuclease [Pseudomarimonas arenosa]
MDAGQSAVTQARQSPVNAALEAAFSCHRLLRPAALALSLGLLLGCQPGAETNAGPVASLEESALRNIGALQGRDTRSPYEGRTVSVQGVVTANVVNGLGGFFLQDATGAEDGDLATADAVFVEWAKGQQPKIRRGDRLSVHGRVVERGDGAASMTTLSEAKIEVLGRAAVRITELQQAPRRLQDWEALEGMWIRIKAPLTVTGNASLHSYGELVTAFDGELFNPTELHPPGPKSRALAEDNLRRSLLLDDARQSSHPERLWFLEQMPDAEHSLRAGSRLFDVEGVLDQRFGQRRLQLTAKLGTIEHAERPPPPSGPEGLRVAGINLHNLFNGDGRGKGFPTERGAASLAEYRRQRDKLVQLISALRPDIAALSEVENDGNDAKAAISDLLAELNKQLLAVSSVPEGAEPPRYQLVADADLRQDPIRVALIYRADLLQPVGEPLSLARGPFGDGRRPPLAQSFRSADGGVPFTVVANHLKSKGGCPSGDNELGNRDQGDGQGCWNQARVEAARALDAWIKEDPTGSGSPYRLLIGDLNAHSQEDPLRLLRSLGWRDALPLNGEGPRPTSYRFDGRAGRLDHILISPELQSALLFATSWPANSAESQLFGYKRGTDSSPYGASDHDPVLAIFDLTKLRQP